MKLLRSMNIAGNERLKSFAFDRAEKLHVLILGKWGRIGAGHVGTSRNSDIEQPNGPHQLRRLVSWALSKGSLN